MKKLLLLVSALFLSFSLSAADDHHPMTKMTGPSVDLSSVGHTIAGRIGDKLIFGDVSSQGGHKSSEVTLKYDGQDIKATFANNGGAWGGELKTIQKTQKVEFSRIDKSIPAYFIKVDGVEYKVRVDSDDFKNNHFINPTYTLELNGQDVAVKMENGQACWMYSLHLIFMIFGTYLL
ncbi:MAG: hypothetical protein ACPGJV_11460 [Bacteriovoracaceae bacterium]